MDCVATNRYRVEQSRLPDLSMSCPTRRWSPSVDSRGEDSADSGTSAPAGYRGVHWAPVPLPLLTRQ